MADIYEYLKWRGDLNLMVSPLNEVDAYILSKFGVLNYTGIIPKKSGIVLSDAVKEFNEAAEKNENLLHGFSENNLTVIRAISQLPRFSSLYVCDYVRKIDETEDRQFSALTIVLPDGTRFVTFRGTDDNLVSWKEDLLLTTMDSIPSHEDAYNYLLKQCKKSSSPIIVSGHSKGGNMAIHASMNIPDKYQDQIISIFNFDGPGFRSDLNDSEKFLRIKPKVRKYASQNSIVGRLLVSESSPIIVSTSETGWRAHNGLNWDIDTVSFTRADEFSSTSNAMQAAFNSSVDAIPMERRKDFIDEFFNTLYENGVHMFTDLNRKKLQELSSQSPEVYRSQEVRALISALSKGYLQEAVANVVNSLPTPPKPKISSRRLSRLHEKIKGSKNVISIDDNDTSEEQQSTDSDTLDKGVDHS